MQVENGSLNRIQLQSRIISMEASTADQALVASTERLPEFLSDVKNFIVNLFSFDSDDTPTIGMDRDLLKMISSVPYGNMTDVNVICPPGLKSDYKTYFEVLSSFGYGHAPQLITSVLAPFNRWLGIVLTNPTVLQSLRSDKSIDNLSLYDVEGIKKRIADCFDNKQVNTTTGYMKAFRSHNDFKYVNENTDALVKHVGQIDQDEIGDQARGVAEKLNLLMDLIAKPGNDYRVSGNAVKTLVEISYIIARECEFFSVYRFQLQAFAIALKDSNTTLKEQLKSKVK